MGIQVREESVEAMKAKLNSMATPFNKIAYLESAIRISGLSYEVKRFILGELAKLYEGGRMFDKAAKVMSNKAPIEITPKDKIESYLRAAEFYSLAGKVDEADDMFVRAGRDCKEDEKAKIRLARKNIFLVNARELDRRGKSASAMRFYEKLVKLDLSSMEKEEIRLRLIKEYRALGRFKDAQLLGDNK